MTRVHVRLLGPCFKTGPKSTQSSSVADRYLSRVNERGGLSKVAPYCQQRARTGDGARSVPPGTVALACDGLDARAARPDTVACTAGQPAGRPGVCRVPFYRRRDSQRTRAVDRHPAGRDVLLGEKCTTTNAGHRRTVACPREYRGTAPRGIAHRREACAADDESPRSIFWVS